MRHFGEQPVKWSKSLPSAFYWPEEGWEAKKSAKMLIVFASESP